jgi:hypothetical protein
MHMQQQRTPAEALAEARAVLVLQFRKEVGEWIEVNVPVRLLAPDDPLRAIVKQQEADDGIAYPNVCDPQRIEGVLSEADRVWVFTRDKRGEAHAYDVDAADVFRYVAHGTRIPVRDQPVTLS